MALGFVAGIAVAGATMNLAQVRASVDTNGVRVGYTVQKDGQESAKTRPLASSFVDPKTPSSANNRRAIRTRLPRQGPGRCLQAIAARGASIRALRPTLRVCANFGLAACEHALTAD